MSNIVKAFRGFYILRVQKLVGLQMYSVLIVALLCLINHFKYYIRYFCLVTLFDC